MALVVRPLGAEDEYALIPIDVSYSVTHLVEPMVGRTQLSFYSRAGHSFIAEERGVISGFVLGHAIWDGSRPSVRIRRVVSSENQSHIRAALLDAVVKSAYDSGVYDIELEFVSSDEALRAVLEEKGFELKPIRLYNRRLGSQAMS